MQKIIAGNWKMYKTRSEAAKTAAQIAEAVQNGTPFDRLILVFPPFIDIATVADAFAGIKNTGVGAQNFYPAKEGAFTGEIAPDMIKDAGAAWALTGHSERRHIFGETDALVAEKTAYGLENGLKIMLCVGETLSERDAGDLKKVLLRQLSSAINPLLEKKANIQNLSIAYEPVWAIGTGKVAGTPEIVDAHAEVKAILASLLGSLANQMPVLYGGSVKPENAKGILGIENVDGLLIGGASLKPESFIAIAQS